MTISSIGGANAITQAQGAGAAKGKTDAASFEKILEAFTKEAAKTPAERARDEVLKKNNLTEDSYKALPPERKKAIDAEIATAVQRVMGADKGKGFKVAEVAAQAATGLANGVASFLFA